jgi:hypothetical protein
VKIDPDVPRGDEWPNLSELDEPRADFSNREDKRVWGFYVRLAIEVLLVVIAVVYLRGALARYFP